jgi:imidazole glycerol-phosphate synthase subunit HisH
LKLCNEVTKVGVIDYGMGNIYSVVGAFEYIGASVDIVSDPDEISKYSTIVLPGVGSFRMGMEYLSNRGLDVAIIDSVLNQKAKILGICLGMHLMGSSGTEDGNTKGLGILPNKVERFKAGELAGNKLPHVGFNTIFFDKEERFFKGLPSLPDFYFIHSYRMLLDDTQQIYATCKYGVDFLAAIKVDNIYGVQFHPEKSQTNGLTLLKNFLTESS